jgi:hypothetical protein
MYGKSLSKPLSYEEQHCFHIYNPGDTFPVCCYASLECAAQTLSHANRDADERTPDRPRKDVSIYAYVVNVKTKEKWTRHEALQSLERKGVVGE